MFRIRDSSSIMEPFERVDLDRETTGLCFVVERLIC